MAKPSRYLNAADIATRLNVPRHRVVYVLAFYEVPWAVMVGESKGYTEGSVATVRDHLDRIESARLANR